MATESLKILTIDDNQDNLITLKAVISDAFPGVKIISALNGPKGIELALAESPDVILLDIVMPQMDGYMVCRRLKADERLRHIPVVFLTALRTDRESRIRALEAGAEAFLVKPLDEVELTAQIRAMVKVKALNVQQRQEREELAVLIAQRTEELEQELKERRKAEKDLQAAHAELQNNLLAAEYSRQVLLQLVEDQKRAEQEKERLQEQLLQSQKMESVGRLAGGVAHDFNNWLGVIMGHAERALEKIPPQHIIYHDLQEILNAAGRSSDLTRQLLAFARKQAVNPRVIDLNSTISSMLEMFQRLIGEDIELIWRPTPNLWHVQIDPSQIDQILANLLVNARDAISGVGKVVIETSNIACSPGFRTGDPNFVPGEYTLLSISDDGIGMEKDTLARLFEPFFTTKDVGKGTGLGLATVYGILRQNNGFVDVYSEPGHGTTFKVYLPRVDAEVQPLAESLAMESSPPGTEMLLIVEDEQALLEMEKESLEELGYTVLAAGSPAEAIRLADHHQGNIHLLITDVIMPEMNGKALAKQLRTNLPDLKCLFMSGYTADIIAHHGVLDDGVFFIQKPFPLKDLAIKVRQVLEQKGSSPLAE
jgi:signal transduction histidine kinase